MCLDLVSVPPSSPKGIYRPLIMKENEIKNILTGEYDEAEPLLERTCSLYEFSKRFPSSLLDTKLFTLLAVSFAFLYLSDIIVFSGDL